MTDLFGDVQETKRPRSPNGVNVHRFLEGFGIDVLPYTEARGWKDRPANVIYGGRTISRLMRKDMERTALVIRCIQVSNPRCFEDVVVWGVWQLITAHFAHRKPTDVINLFRDVDVGAVTKRARRLSVGSYGRGTKTWPAIYTLLADAIVAKEMVA